jgi:LCP family protein required for cell wall assembly
VLRDNRAAQLAGRAARRATATPGRRRLVRVVLALVIVLGLVLLYPLGLYVYVDRSMDRVAALATDGPEVLAPQLQAGSENYLVVGTRVPGEQGPSSVATLLVSVAPDGSRAVLLTVPSTALVDTPECRAAGGHLRDPRTEALASALLDGGPTCMVRAVQEVSGLRIDHYIDLDLSRLPGMVDALGGVPVCVQPSAAVAAASRPLPAGSSRMTGAEAAAYLRPADPRADATGVEVAQRAQLLLTATLHAAISRSTLTDPASLTRFLHRAAGALTVDDGTTLGDLRSLGSSLGALSDTVVQRAALPVAQEHYVPRGGSHSYVLLDDGRTRSLFDAVIGRTRVPAGMAESARPQPAPAPAGPAAGTRPATASRAAPAPAGRPLTVPPAQITADVLNGTSTTGLAGKAAAALRAQGFVVGTVGNAPAAVSGTVVRYGPQAAEQARTLAAAVPGAVLRADPAGGATVQLVVGPNWSTVVPVHVGPVPSSPPAPASAAVTSATAAPVAPAVVRC